MWKIIECSESKNNTVPVDTRLRMLHTMKEIPHDDMLKVLNFFWEWRQSPNLVMEFGHDEAEIEFFAPLVKAYGDHIDLGLYLIRKRQQAFEAVEVFDWTATHVFFLNHIHTCFADNKRKKEQVGWKIRNSRLKVVNGDLPACGMSWQKVYKVYAPCLLTKHKHWVALMIDLVNCEIKVYDSMVSLIPDETLKEELAPLSSMLHNLLNAMDFLEEGVYANNCNRDWWCPWPIERVDVPHKSNE